MSMKLSLKHKTAIEFIFMSAILSITLIFVSSLFLRNTIDTEFRTRATDVSKTVAVSVDDKDVTAVVEKIRDIMDRIDEPVLSDEWGSDRFNEFLLKFSSVTKMPEYQQLLSSMRRIQNVNEVDCIYIVFLMPKFDAWVYAVDAAEEDACPPGVMDPIYEQNRAVLSNPDLGFPAYITDTPEYGWLVTAGVPIYDRGDHKTVIAYACTDISMNEVRASQWDVTRRLIIMMVFLAAIITWIMIHIVNSSVIHPINKLTSASHNFITCKNIESHCFENLGIRTGDEIELLADSMEQMEKSLNQNISNLLRVSDELNLTQNMVTKDGLTGIRNKFGYMKEVEKLEEELANGETKFGIVMIDMNYLKKINDEYGHERGDIALITVSNIICNVFVHSPVYRYGGDEFVVVLRHNDYDKIEELKTLFEKTIEEQEKNESLQPWERVSASLGYALYDPDLDHDVEDVFRRADKAMYDRKVEMKTVRL